MTSLCLHRDAGCPWSYTTGILEPHEDAVVGEVDRNVTILGGGGVKSVKRRKGKVVAKLVAFSAEEASIL